mmetsp:Transcript_20675/g.48279  ORF Transcript_20675/g.48279 Transcript_20675/m.48279 type:complete len:303 (-) Transcript_20675:32-940(-)
MKVLHYLSLAFESVKQVPVLGRLADLASCSLVTCLRGASGGFVASGLDKCARPAKRLKIYEFEGCPYCRIVRETLSVLALDAEIVPCPRSTLKAAGVVENSRFRAEVTKLGGKQSYPFLVDENTGVHMNESADINAYLWKTYGASASPPWTYWLGQKLFIAPVKFLPALCRPSLTHGVLRVPSRPAEKPLELWGCEGSPFVRLVREALSVLELPYILRQVPHGEVANRAEFREKYGQLLSTARNTVGAVQMPFLRDPNTNTELLESADIVNYLFATYQAGPSLDESWMDFVMPGKSQSVKAE